MAQALFVCAAFLLGVKCVLGDFVTLGKPVNFSSTQTCTDGREFTLIRRLRDDKPVTVARREDGVWKASTTVTFGLNYTDRIENQSDLAVAITHTNYNDEGLYEFTCGGSVVTSIQLEVVIPIPLYVSEGETVQLPCHSVTAGEPVKSVRWEKEAQLVIEVDSSSGKITYGTGSGGKVSVPPDWFSRGDLTLTLSRADLQDRGDYFCYIQGENGKRRRGDPAAASLAVKRSPDQTTTPPPARPTQKDIKTWVVVFITVVVTSGIVGPLAFGLGWWKSSVSSGSGGGRPQTHEELALRHTSGPQVNGEAANGSRG